MVPFVLLIASGRVRTGWPEKKGGRPIVTGDRQKRRSSRRISRETDTETRGPGTMHPPLDDAVNRKTTLQNDNTTTIITSRKTFPLGLKVGRVDRIVWRNPSRKYTIEEKRFNTNNDNHKGVVQRRTYSHRGEMTKSDRNAACGLLESALDHARQPIIFFLFLWPCRLHVVQYASSLEQTWWW